MNRKLLHKVNAHERELTVLRSKKENFEQSVAENNTLLEKIRLLETKKSNILALAEKSKMDYEEKLKDFKKQNSNLT